MPSRTNRPRADSRIRPAPHPRDRGPPQSQWEVFPGHPDSPQAPSAEYVILQGSSYVTMASQSGTVTDVSSDSLAVKSEGGFSRTYAVGADVQVSEGMRQRGGGSNGGALDISAVTSGSTVRITALKSSDTYTAQTILLAAGSRTAAGSGAGATTN